VNFSALNAKILNFHLGTFGYLQNLQAILAVSFTRTNTSYVYNLTVHVQQQI